VQRFSGNASTTTFTLSRAVNFPTELEVFVENIQQEPIVAFNVSGNTLTFSESPPTGTNNIYVAYRQYVNNEVTLADGSVTYSKLANNIRLFTTDNFIPDGSTTTFTLSEAPADANTLFVMVDGMMQRAPVHYTTSGKTITFTSAPTASSNVHVRHLGFRTTSTITAFPANSSITQLTLQGNTTANGNLYVLNGNVGIGTASPTTALTVGDSTIPTNATPLSALFSTNTGAGNLVTIRKSNDGTNAPGIAFIKSRGTASSPTIVQSGDNVGALNFYSWDGSTYAIAAQISAVVDATPGAGDMPGRIVFSTTADGASTITERMRINSNGNVGIGVTSTSGYKVAVGGSGLKNQFITTDENNAYLYTDGGAYFGATGANNSVFITNNIERMRIESNGNANIGGVADAGNTLRYFDVYNANTGASAGVNMRLITSNVAGSGVAVVDITKYKNGAFIINNNESNSAAYTAFGVGSSERMRIDSSGNVLVTNVAGLGYGAGAGGTVTQATSKSTAVTLNKPTGQITMNAAALAATTTVAFTFNSTLIAAVDNLLITLNAGAGNAANYNIWSNVGAGGANIYVRNISGGSLSDALVLNFSIIKGATS